jgi:mannonate dehydratase
MSDDKKHPGKTIEPFGNPSSSTPIIVMYPGLAEPTDEYLLFTKQLGLDTVLVAGLPEHLRNVEGLLSIKKRYNDAGIKVYSIVGPIGMQRKEIVLNMPGRDKLIEDYLNWIRTLSKAGFHYTNSGFMGGTGVWTTRRGGDAKDREAGTREFDEKASTITQFPKMALWGDRTLNEEIPSFEVNKLAFGREYSREEILENWTYFIRKVVPVVEECGVYVGFHPDDPPGYPTMAGVARIFSSFESIKEALQIANSPNIGIILCGGIWLEGGQRMGADLTEAIRWFVTNKKTWEVHFRNVSSPLPHFLETFPDNGYYDMYKAMKALVDAGYGGAVHLDHSLEMVGSPHTYQAFATGYMKACLQRALAEANKT